MANKKNYYNRRNKRPKKNASESTINEVLTIYSQEQLALTLKDLGISDTTCALLNNNNINLASDLVKRTEKDMYRVQGLNKKILFEVKDALKAQSMTFRVEEVSKQEQKTQKQNAQNTQTAQGEKKQDKKPQQVKKVQDKKTKPQKQDVVDDVEEVKGSKFGLADKKSKNQKTKKQDAQKPDKPKSDSASPQLGEWRKVLKGGKWGYSDGYKIVIPTMYDEIFAFKEGLASVEIEEKCGYIDEENNVVIPLDYETAMSFSEGVAMVVKNGKCGYINKNNEVVIQFEYDAATPFENGEAKIKKDGKWGTLTMDNKVVWI